LGIYAISSENYDGGLQFTLIEGASFDKNRRRLSEDFELNDTAFDKHIIFKFAQFRSTNIGWFSRVKLTEKIHLDHQFGLGIFGTTEKDQLFDLGLHNSFSLLLGNVSSINYKIGLMHDAQVGTGNPNYKMSNVGVLIGASRSF